MKDEHIELVDFIWGQASLIFELMRLKYFPRRVCDNPLSRLRLQELAQSSSAVVASRTSPSRSHLERFTRL